MILGHAAGVAAAIAVKDAKSQTPRNENSAKGNAVPVASAVSMHDINLAGAFVFLSSFFNKISTDHHPRHQHYFSFLFCAYLSPHSFAYHST